MEFIEGPKASGCFLCEAAALPPGKEAERLVLARTSSTLALMNLYPYSHGHLLVAPAAHVADFDQLDPQTSLELTALSQRSLRALRAALRPDGFNLGMNLGQVAGAGLADHLHQHLVPRWSGDTNFMPVLADVKVMSEHIRVTYQKLRAAFEAVP
jgi:ATP adenylyltransferase